MHRHNFPSAEESAFYLVLSRLGLMGLYGSFWDPTAYGGQGAPIYVIKPDHMFEKVPDGCRRTEHE